MTSTSALDSADTAIRELLNPASVQFLESLTAKHISTDIWLAALASIR
jgi:hypothetical protein